MQARTPGLGRQPLGVTVSPDNVPSCNARGKIAVTLKYKFENIAEFCGNFVFLKNVSFCHLEPV